MFPYGSRLFASGLLYNTMENVYKVIIGKFFSAAELGYFIKAQQIQERPIITLTQTVGSVTFPVFSSIQDIHFISVIIQYILGKVFYMQLYVISTCQYNLLINFLLV